MSLAENIQEHLSALDQQRQAEVMDFILFLEQRQGSSKNSKKQRKSKKLSLSSHPAFGSWKGRGIDSLVYEQNLRSEWENS